MTRPIRVFDGVFGRLQLVETTPGDPPKAFGSPRIVARHAGGEVTFTVDGEQFPLSRETLLFLNPGVVSEARPAEGAQPAQLVIFEASADWLRGRFPAVFESGVRPFPSASEAITQRIRQLLDTLAIEVLNDQFLSHERLEFMLQELMLSIVETYVARRQTASRLWRGSPFADLRIRRALALLRARPNKEVNMNDLASQVGLSRSRFYDLFHLSTGHSPRAYLDLLCVETAIARLSSGSAKIAQVSAELGFSAQSNFTRFFQQQVGIPPSEYRRAASRPPEEDPQ
jgi:AraC family transcriptional regulator